MEAVYIAPRNVALESLMNKPCGHVLLLHCHLHPRVLQDVKAVTPRPLATARTIVNICCVQLNPTGLSLSWARSGPALASELGHWDAGHEADAAGLG